MIGSAVLSLCVLTGLPGPAASKNLVASGDFRQLDAWSLNEQLRTHGGVTRLVADRGVALRNPAIDRDGSLYQEIATEGHKWFSYSARIRGDSMQRASLGFVALDTAGNVLSIVTPTKVSGTQWKTYSGRLNMPEGTARLRVVLSVINGQCSFADLEVERSDPPSRAAPKVRVAAGRGFAVTQVPIERPFWELFCDDLDGDGEPEVAGCDVDGVVTLSKQGQPPFLSFDAGALVYQFAAADFDGDGVKELLFSSVDPKLPARAINLKGSLVRTFAASRGPERLEAADMDGDGKPEVAATVGNGVAGSGVASGVVLFDDRGNRLWEKTDTVRAFRFGRQVCGMPPAMVVGGAKSDFVFYDKRGFEVTRFSPRDELLEQFELADLDGDGRCEIVASWRQGNGLVIACLDGQAIRWEAPIPAAIMGVEGISSSVLHACGDFDPDEPGSEVVIVGTHGTAMFDSNGFLVYQSAGGGRGEPWQTWMPGRINALDIGYWEGREPYLFLSSSRYRHRAYYRLRYAAGSETGEFTVPDQEKHIDEIYAAVKQMPALPHRSEQKVKVFMAQSSFAQASADTLGEYRTALDAMETPSLEYLAMYEASDLLGHERGYKLTTDQIVARAALLERTRIPFGYFAAHGGQVWISREAIERSKQAAPTMFRFLYIAENLETLYSPLYKDVLRWTDETLDFCSDHGMKMIFKEKHDVWGLLPSDPEVSRILFSPRHRDATVPVWSTNQPYQPEIQLGGMLGLKLAGLCREFGMSTQYWNWHEWGRYPRGIRDLSAPYVCPADIMLRLELMGLALGGTWVHIEGGQPYLRADVRQGIAPLATRHRELAYELVRKNIITAGALPANLSKAVVVRSFHAALEQSKTDAERVAYPYYQRNTPPLRRGLIPARYLFEPYPDEALPRLAYHMDWNVRTCFPETPYGWLAVVPPDAWPMPARLPLFTDGERVRIGAEWQTAGKAAGSVSRLVAHGAGHIALQADGACLIIQPAAGSADACVAVLIDPGYLAPVGVSTRLRSASRHISRVTDLVGGEVVASLPEECPVEIAPGAFRILKIEFETSP